MNQLNASKSPLLATPKGVLATATNFQQRLARLRGDMETVAAISPKMTKLCPKCGLPDSEDLNMVCCDQCDDWYHFKCAGVTEEIKKLPWSCEPCAAKSAALLAANVSVAPSVVSSFRSHTSSSILLGLRLLDEDFQMKQANLAAEKEREQRQLKLDAEYAEKQRLLQEEHQKKRRELLAAQPQEKAGGSVIDGGSVRSSRSSVQKWLVQHFPEAANRKNDPRGAIPKQGERTLSKKKGNAALSQPDPAADGDLQFDDDLERSFFQLQSNKELAKTEAGLEENNGAVNDPQQVEEQGAAAGNPTGIIPKQPEPRKKVERQREQPPAAAEEQISKFAPRCDPRLARDNIPGVERPYGLGHAGGITPLQLAARHAMPRKLPPFRGNPEEWPFFISNFITTTEACGYTNAENLARLQECLKDKAFERVRNRLLLPQSVPGVIETLRKRYGRPALLLEVLHKKVEECEAPKLSDLRTFSPFSDVVEQLCDHLEATNQDEHLMNPTLLKSLVLKLPSEIALKWAHCTRDKKRINLRTFADFIAMIADDADELTPIFPAKRSPPNQAAADRRGDKKVKEKGFIHVHADSSGAKSSSGYEKGGSKGNSTPKPCRICESTDHRIRNCEMFKRLDHEGRMKAVDKWKLCRICLNEHGDARCRFKIQCNIDQCTERHNPLLHPTKKPIVEAIINMHGNARQQVVFRLATVTLHHGNRSVETTAFVDEGSSMSLVEQSLVDQLGVKAGIPEPLQLLWTANIGRVERNSKRVGLQISASGAPEKHHLKLRTVSELRLPEQGVNVAVVASSFDHLRDLPCDGEFRAPKLLLGLDNLHLFAPVESRVGRPYEPIAVRSKLGWTIYGPVGNHIPRAAFINVHAADNISNQDLHDLIREYFAVEEVGVSAAVLESGETRRAREILDRTTVRVGDRFETGLLWRLDDYYFPNSYPMAFRRLLQLEKKLAKTPTLAENVRRQIEEYQQKQYAHKASPKELAETDPRKVWYIPLNVVVNPKKPSKVRLVWDAAAEVDGVSLNGMLLKGPDLLVSLIEVLCCFRERRFGFGGDLAEMYHQVRIRTADKQAQRFLFRADTSAPPVVYVMDVATFGATSSPTSAQFVKNKNADEYAHRFPEAAAAIKRRHYVDDYFDSADTEEEAIQRAREVKFIHSKGGFHIRNWVSNSTRFLEELGEPTQKEAVQFTSDKHTNVERILGITWNPAEDVFSFSIPTNEVLDPYLSGEQRPTKKLVLKFLMSFFDPLGLVAPFLVHGKILMQDIWRSGCAWKDEIDDECYAKWTQWIDMLPRLELLRIPRSYFGAIDMSEVKSVELHVFTDASEKAYGCAAFLRIVHAGRVHCALVMGKTKVAPLKLLSIPRIELEGARLGARIANTAESCHSLPITRRVLWTDSATVMSWMQSDPRKYKPGVAFRLADIQSLTNTDEWKWVPTKCNVADELTKRGRNFSCSESDRWIRGPEFLYLDEEHWPRHSKPAANTSEGLRATFLLHDVVLPNALIDVHRFSRWRILVRTVACVFRFASNCRRKARGLPIEAVPAVSKLHKLIVRSIAAKEEPLKQEEYRLAENYLWRQAQKDDYADELKILIKNRDLPAEKWHRIEKSSSLKCLSPFIDEADVLRMEGRTKEGELLTFDQRFPIILPKTHAITYMLMEHYHQEAGHGQNEMAVNEIRQHYHIDALRSGIAKVARNCQRCKVRKCKPRIPRMAPLPKERVSPHLRPFSFVGIDYCGPVVVTVGRRSEKRWIVVFTCFNTRAVHLEVAHGLTTQSCIMAIKRFMSRYGMVREIFSDNGTNFRGVDNTGVLVREINSKCADAVVNARLKWTFNPPSAPHMGGVWERVVRSVKEVLRALDEGCRLTDEILLTTLAEVCDMVNSRPLTYQPTGPDCPNESLTPNHFLRVGPDNGELVQEPTTLAEALRDTYKRSQYIADLLWKRWLTEYVPTLNRRSKWQDEAVPLKLGDVVFIADEERRKTWLRGIVQDIIKAKDGRIRQAIVRTQHGVLKRPVAKLAVVEVSPRMTESEAVSGDVPAADSRAGELLPSQ